MGGLFSAPKPKIVAPPQPAPEPVAAGEEARAENRARASRGVLEQLPGLARKSLLGE